MGGYIAASAKMCDAIRSYAPGFIFTTSLAPAVAAGAAASVAYLKGAQDLRDKHQDQAKVLKLRLKGLGLPIIDHGSHIVPVIVGNPVHTKVLSDHLLEDYGIYVQPINFPTVPRGTERLRFHALAGAWPQGDRCAGQGNGRIVVALCAESCRTCRVTY